MNEPITRSPTASRVTSAPTFSTTPVPSWPRTTLPAGNVPLITDRSEWHTPLAVIRTITSSGPGSRGVTSSTASGWSCSRHIAAFMGFPPACGAAERRKCNLPRYLPAVTRILLVRHGQSVWNADGRWQGQADPPLSDVGVDQAAAAADSDAVDGVRALYSSDLERARHTAQLLGVRLGLDPVVDVRLRERHAGGWEGCTRAEIEAGWPGFLESGERPEGYEPDASVPARVP